MTRIDWRADMTAWRNWRAWVLILGVLAVGQPIRTIPSGAENEDPKSTMPMGMEYIQGESVTVSLEDRPLVTYTHSPLEFGHPHFHPARTPAGHVLTNQAPWDHVWHCGLWFSWKLVNDFNVWEEPALPDGKTEIVPLSIEKVALAENVVSFSCAYQWRLRTGKPLLEGTVDVRIHQPEGDLYWIDLDYSFKGAEGDTVFSRVPYHPTDLVWGGYAGLSYRPIRDFVNPILTSSNSKQGEEPAVMRWEPVRWLDLSGPLDGVREGWGGLCLMDHPSNPRHPVPANFHEPDWWNLRWMQLAFLYGEDYVLPEGESLDLKYRVVVHDGKADVDTFNRIWEAWE